MISTGDKTFFVFEGQDVSGTVARPVALQEEELCHATLDEMYHIQVQIGHFSDDVGGGFASDCGLQGQKTYRYAARNASLDSESCACRARTNETCDRNAFSILMLYRQR